MAFTSLGANDSGPTSRATINTNFTTAQSNLDTKVEFSGTAPAVGDMAVFDAVDGLGVKKKVFTASQTLESDGNGQPVSAAKGTGYNLNLGTTAGTVLEGSNDALYMKLAGAQVVTGEKDFTGAAPLVPTQAALDSSTKAASTAFVQQEIATSVGAVAFGLGAGTATTIKTYWNFEIPYIISTNVPSGDFWTYTNDLTTGYNSPQKVQVIPDANANGSFMTTSSIWVEGYNSGITFATTKKVIVEWGVALEAVGTEQQGFGLSEGPAPFWDYDDASDDATCFTVSPAGALYAHTSNGGGTTNHTETLISGITLTALNTYRIEFDPGVDAKFYVNGTLQATITTTLPNGNSILFGCGVEGKDGGNGGITMTVPYFSIEK